MLLRAFALLLLFVPVVVLAQKTDEKPDERPKPPEYILPDDARFTVTDLKVTREVGEDASFEIAAVLRVPTGDKPAAGRPAVLFISGSGPQTAHGFQGPMDIGSWELLDAIANAGFVVISMDDRAIGGTPLGEEDVDPATIGYNELVGDARACLTALLARDEINKDKVFIIGHSEGGITAPILAGDTDVAGVVFMAAAGRNMYDITYEQVENAMAGQPKAARDANLKAQKEFQDAVKENREPDFNILGAAAAGNLKRVWKTNVLPIRAWWHDHFNLDVPGIHKALTCPCLVTQGAADFQVSDERDARQILKNLADGECRDVTYKCYEDLDHLFKPCNGRESNTKMYFEDRRVDPTFIKDVVDWLKARGA